MAAQRARSERVQKDCHCTGDKKDPVKGLEITVEFHGSPYYKIDGLF